jgi:hypothetical protein
MIVSSRTLVSPSPAIDLRRNSKIYVGISRPIVHPPNNFTTIFRRFLNDCSTIFENRCFVWSIPKHVWISLKCHWHFIEIPLNDFWDSGLVPLSDQIYVGNSQIYVGILRFTLELSDLHWNSQIYVEIIRFTLEFSDLRWTSQIV